jgi:predicted amidohydrolase YtcJ
MVSPPLVSAQSRGGTPRAPRVFVRGRVYAPVHPGATALVSQGDRIVFVGDDDGARRWSSGSAEVNLQGRLVTPAFVDAHLHAVQAGLVAAGLDLHGAASRTDVLDRLAAYAARRPTGVIVGQGWDERTWPDPRPPTGAELDRAAGGRLVYLARVDVHSAVVSTPVLDRLPGVAATNGFGADGMLTQEAHHRSRVLVNALFDDADRRAAARRALRQAAGRGVATVHELGGPHLGPLADLVRVREVGAELGMGVVTYWGELASQAAIDRVRAVGAAGLAGDLCVDGSIGSRTAALSSPYADAETRGARYLDEDQIADHVATCTRAGLQAGFHCIGDDAVATAVAGLRRAAERVGVDRIRPARHRLEHLEMVAVGDIATLARLGVVASVQPAFDARWGGPGELYETRLGLRRAQAMNPLGALRRAGVPLAFGTDAPVTPLAGWAMVQAATEHSRPSEQLRLVDAFAAATSGGHWAGGADRAGTLECGALASFAVWDVQPAPTPAVPELPRLEPEGDLPPCVLTVAGGRIAFRSDAEPVG